MNLIKINWRKISHVCNSLILEIQTLDMHINMITGELLNCIWEIFFLHINPSSFFLFFFAPFITLSPFLPPLPDQLIKLHLYSSSGAVSSTQMPSLLLGR